MSVKLKLIFIFLGLVIGVLTTSQLLTSIPAGGSFPLDQIQAKEELLDTLNNEQIAHQSRIVFLREKIEEIGEKNKLSQQEGTISRLDNLKEIVGLTAVNGAGLQITLDDGIKKAREGEEVSLSLVHAGDLRDIVNVLRTAGAKALAINNQRILATSSIISVGNSILVNNVNVSPPYLISAIGDEEILSRTIQESLSLAGLKQRVVEGKIKLAIDIKKNISIPIYNGSFRTKHID